MPDTLLHTNKPSLAYAKLVATPTESSWSQVYNAGSLFACLSLIVKDEDAQDEQVSLHAAGKEIFNILESEFFSLPEKNMHTIKNAIQLSIEHAPSSISVNLSLALFKEDILYVFIAGGGKIIMKRGEHIAVLLEQKSTAHTHIAAASGYLKDKDTIVLETEQFAKDISEETVASALDLALPNDIAEALSPQIHEQDDGGQAAIVIVYHGIATPHEEEELDGMGEKDLAALYEEHTQEEPTAAFEEEEEPAKPSRKKSFALLSIIDKLPKIHMPPLRIKWLNHKRRLFLSIAVVLVLLLTISIYLTNAKQEADKRKDIFQTIYVPAEKFYEEGKGLQSLNKNLSRDNFLKAQKLIQDGQPSIKKDTPEYQKLQELLTKVEAELESTSGNKGLPAKEVSAGKNSLLDAEKAHAGALTAGENGTTVYLITDKAVTSVDKNSGNKKDVITNDSDWTSPQAVVPYQGNIYVLDQKKGVLKYTAGSDGFGKSSYFKQNPDLSKATGMAIDGSVWIANGGEIFKYTRGESDGFKTKGLDKPFSPQTKLFTNLDTDNIYVLDKGNARVVKLSKDGSFQTQYVSNIISDAKDFEVKEKENKLLILAQDKVWEIEMK